MTRKLLKTVAIVVIALAQSRRRCENNRQRRSESGHRHRRSDPGRGHDREEPFVTACRGEDPAFNLRSGRVARGAIDLSWPPEPVNA